VGDFSGKVAIVTGGNGGIGAAIAVALAQSGARVAIAARNPEKNRAMEARLRDGGAECLALSVDVQREEQIRECVATVEAQWGRLDILVNNAGIVARRRATELSAELWRSVLDTNLTAAFLGAHYAAPVMARGGGGKILNIGSMYSYFGAQGLVAYAASKTGLLGLTRTLAVELAQENIQVNALAPGWFVTDMTRPLTETAAAEAIRARTPAGRWGTDADLQGPALFLLSDAADFVTGQILAVDGGYSVMGLVAP
jgi:2-deoxy-D-gluconate 3-dehydrogenase